MKGRIFMTLENGNLKLDSVDYDHIQARIDEEDMTLQEAVETELLMHGIKLKDVYTLVANMGKIGKHLELYCKIACGVKSGRNPRK